VISPTLDVTSEQHEAEKRYVGADVSEAEHLTDDELPIYRARQLRKVFPSKAKLSLTIADIPCDIESSYAVINRRRKQ